MENITFEMLPAAVGLLLDKVIRIEQLLEKLGEAVPDPVKMLNIGEAAELLDVSVASIYTKVSRREIPVYKPGKRLYFKEEELLEWMTSNRRKTNQEIREDAGQHLATLARKRKARRY